MFEFIKAIAILCSIGSSSSVPTDVFRVQLECQKYYVRCVDSEEGRMEDRLKVCLLKKDETPRVK